MILEVFSNLHDSVILPGGSGWGFADPLPLRSADSPQPPRPRFPPRRRCPPRSLAGSGSDAWLPLVPPQAAGDRGLSRPAMATPDVSVHMEEVVVVTTPDGAVDGAGVEEVKTVLVTTNLSQHG